MLVVSDSSPLINLYLIGRFNLLPDFFGKIIVPAAVWHELLEEGKEGVDFFQAEQKKGIIAVRNSKASPLLPLLLLQLDGGEAEAIALAIQEKAGLVLIDEKEGREIARKYNLQVTGVIGILMRAKMKKIIHSLRKELEFLQQQGFWIKEELFDQALFSCRER